MCVCALLSLGRPNYMYFEICEVQTLLSNNNNNKHARLPIRQPWQRDSVTARQQQQHLAEKRHTHETHELKLRYLPTYNPHAADLDFFLRFANRKAFEFRQQKCEYAIPTHSFFYFQIIFGEIVTLDMFLAKRRAQKKVCSRSFRFRIFKWLVRVSRESPVPPKTAYTTAQRTLASLCEIRCGNGAHMFVIKFSSIHDFIFDRHSVASSHPHTQTHYRSPWNRRTRMKSSDFPFFLSRSPSLRSYRFDIRSRMHIPHYNYYLFRGIAGCEHVFLFLLLLPFYVSAAQERKKRKTFTSCHKP